LPVAGARRSHDRGGANSEAIRTLRAVEFSTDFREPIARLHWRESARARFVQELDPRDGKGLLLVGGIGTGKTHLAVGILKELIRYPRKRLPFLRLSRTAETDSELLQRFGPGDRASGYCGLYLRPRCWCSMNSAR
jgi:DNA replication protein DnaC